MIHSLITAPRVKRLIAPDACVATGAPTPNVLRSENPIRTRWKVSWENWNSHRLRQGAGRFFFSLPSQQHVQQQDKSIREIHLLKFPNFSEWQCAGRSWAKSTIQQRLEAKLWPLLIVSNWIRHNCFGPIGDQKLLNEPKFVRVRC